jgi:putative Ig domain-containing protein
MNRFARATAKWLSVSVAVVVLQACGGGGGDDPPASPPPPPPPPAGVTAPSALSYPSPQTYTVGTAITALSPTVTGTVTSYAAAPALPAGLAIDATTGVISGTPTQTAAAADYTVTASNSGGSTTFALNVTVNDVPTAPPSGLTYTSPQTYTVGTAITALTPTVTGTVSSYAVAPALPAGIAIDATTGVISGTPTAIAAQADYTVTASNAAGSTTFALQLSSLLERATTDRADKVPAGGQALNQVHVVYVVPSDAGVDRQLDVLGTIEGSVRNWNKWLASQIGSSLRLDTYGDDDRLDVTFVQLAKSDADLNGSGNVRTKIEHQLLAKGFDATNKVYLAYYEGDGDGCASGAWPPTLHGAVSVLYLRGVGNPDCPTTPLAGENDAPGVWEYRGLHEILHPMGFAPACAPNLGSNGHVDDDTRDLLYAGNVPAQSPTRIDLARDDYVGGSTCLDLLSSAYIDPPAAGPQLPEGLPYVNLASTQADCANELSIVLAPTTTDTTITFVNDYAPGGVGTPLSVAELVVGATGNTRTNVNSLPYLEGLMLNSATNTKPKVGTVYVVTTGGVGGECQAIVTATASPSRFVIHAAP